MYYINNKGLIIIKINKEKLIRNIKRDKEKILENRNDYMNTCRVGICSEEIFSPIINDDDDKLVRIVKKILIKNQKPMAAYASKFESQMQMSNFKRSLGLNNTMSFAKFSKWMEILDYDWKLVLKKKQE